MALGPANILYDGSGNPLAVSPNAAIATGQSALATVGSDYATTPSARVQKVDASGQQYCVPVSSTGVGLPVGVNAAGSSTGGFGVPAMGFDYTTNYWRPHSVNTTGNLVTAPLFMNTFSAVGLNVATGVTNGKSLISIFNAGTNYLRLASLFAVCPPQLVVTGALTAVQQTYNAVLVGGYRFTTAHTGGTLATLTGYDPADTVDTNITVRTLATIGGEAAAPLFVGDAAYNAAVSFMNRDDEVSKLLVIAPSTGFHFRLIAAPSGSVNFQFRLVLTQSAT